jgi:hypothetical protein
MKPVELVRRNIVYKSSSISSEMTLFQNYTSQTAKKDSKVRSRMPPRSNTGLKNNPSHVIQTQSIQRIEETN